MLGLPVLAAAQLQTDLAPDTVIAVIDGEPIRLSEVTAAALALDGKRLFSLNQQLHAVREQALNGLIGERLLAREAKNAGMTIEDYVEALPVERVDEKEVELMLAGAMQRNNAIHPDKLRELIREHLRDQKRQAARRRQIEQLKLEHKRAGKPIVMNLEPPRVKVPVTDTDPSKGAGPVEIIEFSDFQCPYCQKAQPMIRELLAKYRGEGKARVEGLSLAEPSACDSGCNRRALCRRSGQVLGIPRCALRQSAGAYRGRPAEARGNGRSRIVEIRRVYRKREIQRSGR